MMLFRSPALRALFSVALTLGCWFALVAPASAAYPPIVETKPAEDIRETSAVMVGSVGVQPVSPSDSAAFTYHFDYGKTEAYGASTPEKAGEPSPAGQPTRQTIRETVSGLASNTPYFFRLVATTSG